MEYLWTKDVDLPQFPSLDGDRSTDVLIIGGGMAGVLCARMLADAGVDYILAEGGRIGEGITKGTTAVLSAQHDTLYTDLVKDFDSATAKRYLEANVWAVEQFRALSQSIPCEFEDTPSVMYSLTERAKMKREAKLVQALGHPAEFVTQLDLPFQVAGAVLYPGMAQFHPLKFLAGIAKGLTILENTFVQRLEGAVAHTSKGKISARRVIVATHFPFINSRGLYFMKLYQMRSFVVALENAPKYAYSMVDNAEGGMYFRNYQNLLLVGGGDHRTGKQGGGFDAVRDFIGQHFPEATEKYAWANQDCMSLDGLPYIGRYSAAMPNVFVATGFNEWGMTASMVAASLLKDMITGQQSNLTSVFSPDRTMLHAQLFSNMGTTVVDFLSPTTKRCSHLGCALKWNKQEHSWDCPCHGSRFTEYGSIIDNPATKNIDVD